MKGASDSRVPLEQRLVPRGVSYYLFIYYLFIIIYCYLFISPRLLLFIIIYIYLFISPRGVSCLAALLQLRMRAMDMVKESAELTRIKVRPEP